jgi:hypothetical protein
MNDPTIEELRQRINSMEKEHRRWKILSVACIATLVSTGLFNQIRYNRAIDSERDRAERAEREAQRAVEHERGALHQALMERDQAQRARLKAEEELAKPKK